MVLDFFRLGRARHLGVSEVLGRAMARTIFSRGSVNQLQVRGVSESDDDSYRSEEGKRQYRAAQKGAMATMKKGVAWGYLIDAPFPPERPLRPAPPPPDTLAVEPQGSLPPAPHTRFSWHVPESIFVPQVGHLLLPETINPEGWRYPMHHPMGWDSITWSAFLHRSKKVPCLGEVRLLDCDGQVWLKGETGATTQAQEGLMWRWRPTHRQRIYGSWYYYWGLQKVARADEPCPYDRYYVRVPGDESRKSYWRKWPSTNCWDGTQQESLGGPTDHYVHERAITLMYGTCINCGCICRVDGDKECQRCRRQLCSGCCLYEKACMQCCADRTGCDYVWDRVPYQIACRNCLTATTVRRHYTRAACERCTDVLCE